MDLKKPSSSMSSNRFHLAIAVLNLKESKDFYCNFLGCSAGNFETDKWQDINFWGNELTLHQSKNIASKERHNVDMGNVTVPHFGVHLEHKDFRELKEKIKASKIAFLDPPYSRFVNDKREQETFFIEDPSGNTLEIKTMTNPETLFQE